MIGARRSDVFANAGRVKICKDICSIHRCGQRDWWQKYVGADEQATAPAKPLSAMAG
jgi:hypothetical protein